MAQTLLLGLGGTGSRIVNCVAADLKKRGIGINDGQICCAVLDTNANDNGDIVRSNVGVPVVPTSRDITIDNYLKMYANIGVQEWMPVNPALRTENMKDGASQIRAKSRLALLDTIKSGAIHDLENCIQKLLNYRENDKIRVMIVSSLAGGTGSGMFIQTALWIRKFFKEKNCTITIRGIFLLPDPFVTTIEDIRSDDTEIQSLYANAYGAVSELNTITKIKTKGYVPLLPIKIREDDLFDSDRDINDGVPVYDYAFFIDDVAENGAALSSISHYEEISARFVYMQLFAPMHGPLYSEEDNLFRRFQKSDEPVFGSCGTARAVYPADDILRYCALRAAQDSLSTGWRKIDIEIREKQRREDEREKNGAVSLQRIEPRQEYIRLFDAKSTRSREQVGRDRLFANIANDVKNEERIPGEDGKVDINFTDKVEDFLEKLDEIIAVEVDTSNVGELSKIKLNKAWVDQTTDTVSMLLSLVDRKKRDVTRFLEDTAASVDALAENLLDRILPSDMGDINPENTESIYGFLTKKDNNNDSCFVHPIAIRYLLYKLAGKLKETKETLLVDTARQSAEKGYGDNKPRISFDNPRTSRVEDDATAYLNSKALFQSEERFIKTFKSLYSQHNAGQFELCRAYAITALKYRLVVILSQRLEKLIDVVEGFFDALVKVSNTLSDNVAENIRKNAEIAQKTVYVCASGEEKETLYQSLRLNTDDSDTNINQIIAHALYAQFCAKENPEAENNIPYKQQSVENIFFSEVISTYHKLILSTHRDDVDLDIYSAICKSSDIEYERAKANAAEQDSLSDRLDIDLETGKSTKGDEKHQRHLTAIRNMVAKLRTLSAPFLISNDEYPDIGDVYDEEDEEGNTVFTPVKKSKTFWGFNPIVAEKCQELGSILNINVKTQQNVAYSKNELDCYRAVYGIQAGFIPKFNEFSNGDYYISYRNVIRQMVAEGNPSALIHTPHLDKTWHLFLPYITPEKRDLEDVKFYRSFWLALAYGMISLDGDGKYQIERTKENASGQYQTVEPIKYNNESIGKVDVIKLLTALKLDGSFMMNAKKLEKKFQTECEGLDSYESTEFLRGRSTRTAKHNPDDVSKKATIGGLASKQDINAVTIIVRYYRSPRRNIDTAAMLVQALQTLCIELASHRYESGETEKAKRVGYELCKRIYDASAMKDKDIDLIKHWEEV